MYMEDIVKGNTPVWHWSSHSKSSLCRTAVWSWWHCRQETQLKSIFPHKFYKMTHVLDVDNRCQPLSVSLYVSEDKTWNADLKDRNSQMFAVLLIWNWHNQTRNFNYINWKKIKTKLKCTPQWQSFVNNAELSWNAPSCGRYKNPSQNNQRSRIIK